MFLPRKEVAQIRNGTIPEPEYFPRASILNFDIVGYTVISKRSTPKEIFLMLETLFTLFDDTLHNFPNLFKVETLGDSYMISAGCPVKYDSHEMDLARFALQIRCKIHLNFRIQHLNMERLRMRIGIATGGVTSCIPNLNMPKFTVIGEAVQRALTLESECQINRIHCDENTHKMLNQTNLFQFEESSSVSGPAFYILTEFKSPNYITQGRLRPKNRQTVNYRNTKLVREARRSLSSDRIMRQDSEEADVLEPLTPRFVSINENFYDGRVLKKELSNMQSATSDSGLRLRNTDHVDQRAARASSGTRRRPRLMSQ
ncbi:unnamed protein product [Oikopleura dioica]|uniref:Guanylate cyclase domain-containing protein n=1 Tax=Oikopleura dioica TaxID=34765 RepID=E4XMN5_OIKDI|nr:unnamed protein product [Oikopleura dioica]